MRGTTRDLIGGLVSRGRIHLTCRRSSRLAGGVVIALLAALGFGLLVVGGASPTDAATPAAASESPPTPSPEAVSAGLPELSRLWEQLDALQEERQDLGWGRWEALGPVEQARLILRYETAQAPSREAVADLTQDDARKILDRYQRLGAQGQRQLRGSALRLIESDEWRAFEDRRRGIVAEIADLGEDAVPALVAEILDGGPHWPDAQQALGQMGSKPTSALVEALRSAPRGDQRARLVATLAAAKDPQARDVFLRALDDSDASVRQAALEGLEGIGPVSQAIYLRLLEDASPHIRGKAISGLEKVGDAAAIPALLEVFRYDVTLGKGSFGLRAQARKALEAIADRTGTPVSLPPEQAPAQAKLFRRWSFEELVDGARCSNPGIRQNAVSHLGTWFRERRTLELLQDVIRRDPDAGVRAEAVSAVGSLFWASPPQEALSLSQREREQVFDFLLDLVQDEGRVSINAFGAISALAARNWTSFRRVPELFAVVLEWIESGDRHRQRPALRMLSNLGYSAPEVVDRLLTPERRARLLPHLVAGMEDPDVGVRIRFIEALGHLRERTVVPRLVTLLDDENATVRSFAVYSLGRMGDRRALPALEKVATDDPARNDEGRLYLREKARKAVDQIRTSDRG